MCKVLRQNFFNRPTLTVARELIGKYLVRKIRRKIIALKITEVEAYDGPRDRASHAVLHRAVGRKVLHRAGEYKAEKTSRNAPMFGPPGKFYVYFTYGMHWILNVVTGPENYPAAILIRGTNKVVGPARLTKFLSVDKSLNGKPASRKTGLWFEDRPYAVKAPWGKEEKINLQKIIRMPRVGVAYAGALWSKKLYRFVLAEKKNLPK